MGNKIKVTTMDGDAFFWESIRKSNKKGNTNWRTYDIDEHLDSLTKLLAKCSKEQIIQFEKNLQENLYKLYTAAIFELSIILENSFTIVNHQVIFEDRGSSDGFIYFRCWLLLKGKEFFDEIITDINAIINGKYSFNIGDCWAEGLLYVSDRAYAVFHENESEMEIQDAVGGLFPDVVHYDSLKVEMKGELTSGNCLQEKYPQLVKEITQLRST